MKATLALALREIRSQVVSPVAWTVAAGFLLLAGYFFFNLVSQFAVILGNYNLYAQVYQNPEILDRVNLNEMVVAGLARNLLVLLLFVVPVLTMRSFAEERRQGTDELILTSPVSPLEVVAGKYLGTSAVVLAIVGASAFFAGILLRYGDPERGPMWTAWLGLLLVTAALTALGIAVSAATESQVVAGFGSFVLFLMLFVADWPAESLGGAAGATLRAIALPEHFEGFSRGVVSSADVVYFASLAALGLFAARTIVASQRWR
jgi:ABC-2 type transport system permease protein